VHAYLPDWEAREQRLGQQCETKSDGNLALRDGKDPEELLQKADDALYKAKHEGSNRVRSASLFRRVKDIND